MAAGDRVPYYLRGAKYNGDPVAGACYAVLTPRTSVHEDPGTAAHAGGPADVQVANTGLRVELYGRNPAALLALLDVAAAAVILQTKGTAGANWKETLTKVLFTEPLGQLELRDPDTGGPVGVYGVAGEVLFDEGQGLANVWTSAVDA